MMSGKPMSLAICDIDHFKKFNDTYGHDVGDRVLRFVSSVLLENCGRRGAVSRHGGEEFVVIFEETTPEMAYEIIDADGAICLNCFVNKDTDDRSAMSPSRRASPFWGNRDVGHLLAAPTDHCIGPRRTGRNCDAGDVTHTSNAQGASS
ncbi:MAG: GGDEF domain-containing protein [Sphingomonadales bacterium]|nr:GGDEF domain-containing protein [Sphingomonadales bacterium]